MSRDKEEQARREGMAYALRVAKEKGIEELEKDLKMRNATKMPVAVQRKDVMSLIGELQENCYKTALLMMSFIVHDKFGFGRKRLNKLLEEFDKTAHDLAEGWMCWDDITEIMQEECGMTYSVPDEIRELSIKMKEIKSAELAEQNGGTR